MMIFAGILFLISFTFLLVVFIKLCSIVLQLFSDKIEKHSTQLGLKKAALHQSKSLEDLRRTIIPTRKSVFSRHEETIWVKEGDNELFISSNRKYDVRIWFQPLIRVHGLHIVLDGTKNNLLRSNLTDFHLPKNHVALEGNFNDNFKLYYGDGQHILALQIISPEIMAYLQDELLFADIEITETHVALIIKDGARSKDSLSKSLELAERLSKIIRAVEKVRH